MAWGLETIVSTEPVLHRHQDPCDAPPRAEAWYAPAAAVGPPVRDARGTQPPHGGWLEPCMRLTRLLRLDMAALMLAAPARGGCRAPDQIGLCPPRRTMHRGRGARGGMGRDGNGPIGYSITGPSSCMVACCLGDHPYLLGGGGPPSFRAPKSSESEVDAAPLMDGNP
jgi:hypothetical protein